MYYPFTADDLQQFFQPTLKATFDEFWSVLRQYYDYPADLTYGSSDRFIDSWPYCLFLISISETGIARYLGPEYFNRRDENFLKAVFTGHDQELQDGLWQYVANTAISTTVLDAVLWRLDRERRATTNAVAQCSGSQRVVHLAKYFDNFITLISEMAKAVVCGRQDLTPLLLKIHADEIRYKPTFVLQKILDYKNNSVDFEIMGQHVVDSPLIANYGLCNAGGLYDIIERRQKGDPVPVAVDVIAAVYLYAQTGEIIHNRISLPLYRVPDAVIKMATTAPEELRIPFFSQVRPYPDTEITFAEIEAFIPQEHYFENYMFWPGRFRKSKYQTFRVYNFPNSDRLRERVDFPLTDLPVCDRTKCLREFCDDNIIPQTGEVDKRENLGYKYNYPSTRLINELGKSVWIYYEHRFLPDSLAREITEKTGLPDDPGHHIHFETRDYEDSHGFYIERLKYMDTLVHVGGSYYDREQIYKHNLNILR